MQNVDIRVRRSAYLYDREAAARGPVGLLYYTRSEQRPNYRKFAANFVPVAICTPCAATDERRASFSPDVSLDHSFLFHQLLFRFAIGRSVYAVAAAAALHTWE